MFEILSQILKLCNMKGIWGAKISGGLLLGSFVVLEVRVLLSSKNVHHGCSTCCSQAEEERDGYHGDSVLTLSWWFDSHPVAIALYAIFVKTRQRLLPYSIGLTIKGLAAIVYIGVPKQEKASPVDAFMLVLLIIGNRVHTGLCVPLHEVLKAVRTQTGVGLSIMCCCVPSINRPLSRDLLVLQV